MMTLAKHLTREELEAGLDDIRRSPADEGVLEMIVRRPRVGERETVDEAALDTEVGLVGDSWSTRRDPDPDAQLTIMNARLISLVAGDRGRWSLAGDQLFVDLDLSAANLPAGTRLAVGSAVIEITPEPHTGCRKFVSRYGLDAQKFVNSPVGRELRLRGLNARVVRGGAIRRGDTVTKTG
jgi:MOSC domain-containing protein YiiM